MERKTWKVEVDGVQHEVVLNWTYWSGHRQVTVDGQVVSSDAAPMRWQSEQAVPIGAQRAVVRTRPKGRVSPYFAISLELDGREVAPEPGPRSRWER